MTGRAIVLFGVHRDVVEDAGCACSCLRKLLLVSNFVVDVAVGVAEVLGLDWTSSCGEMSSKRCFLKVGGFPSMVRDCRREWSVDTLSLIELSDLLSMLASKEFARLWLLHLEYSNSPVAPVLWCKRIDQTFMSSKRER